MDQRLYSDKPISRPKDDEFGMVPFSEALATSLLQMSPRDGLVISVEGPWGAGKSSAIALAIRLVMIRVLNALGQGRDDLERMDDLELEEAWNSCARLRNTHIVRFNPWNFSGQENLVRAFFAELSFQLDIRPVGWFRRQLDRLSSYLPAFGSTVGTGGALLSGSALPGIAAAAGAVGKSLGEISQKAFAIDHSLEHAKKELAKRLKDADQRIIVVIDDLDRLMSSEMRAVFSLVKSLGDLPNVLYILSFDDKIVHKGLRESAEKIDPDFLEKIVQVSLKLPPPWRQELHSFLITRLNGVIGEAEPANIARWRDVVSRAIDPYLRTPRDVTRLVNALKVIWPNVAGDVDLTDLVALTTLQLFDPKVFAFLRDEIETIIHVDYGYEKDDDFAKRMEPTWADQPQAAKEAMGLLFPRLAKVWRVYLVDSSAYLLQRAQRRVCTQEYYRNYFVFGRDPRFFSRRQLESLIASNVAIKATIGRLILNDSSASPSVSVMLEQISELVYEKPVLTPALVEALLDHSDDLIRREDTNYTIFITQNDDRLQQILAIGIQKLQQPERSAVLQTLKNYKGALLTRTKLIEGEASRHGLFGKREGYESDQLFKVEEVKAAAIVIRDDIADECRSGGIWLTPKPLRLVWAWRRMSDLETVSNWLEAALSDDSSLILFAKALPGRSYRTGGEGSQVVWTFDREPYRDLLDIDNFIEKLRVLSDHSEEAATALQRLLEAEAENDK